MSAPQNDARRNVPFTDMQTSWSYLAMAGGKILQYKPVVTKVYVPMQNGKPMTGVNGKEMVWTDSVIVSNILTKEEYQEEVNHGRT